MVSKNLFIDMIERQSCCHRVTNLSVLITWKRNKFCHSINIKCHSHKYAVRYQFIGASRDTNTDHHLDWTEVCVLCSRGNLFFSFAFHTKINFSFRRKRDPTGIPETFRPGAQHLQQCLHHQSGRTMWKREGDFRCLRQSHLKVQQ